MKKKSWGINQDNAHISKCKYVKYIYQYIFFITSIIKLGGDLLTWLKEKSIQINNLLLSVIKF